MSEQIVKSSARQAATQRESFWLDKLKTNDNKWQHFQISYSSYDLLWPCDDFVTTIKDLLITLLTLGDDLLMILTARVKTCWWNWWLRVDDPRWWRGHLVWWHRQPMMVPVPKWSGTSNCLTAKRRRNSWDLHFLNCIMKTMSFCFCEARLASTSNDSYLPVPEAVMLVRADQQSMDIPGAIVIPSCLKTIRIMIKMWIIRENLNPISIFSIGL